MINLFFFADVMSSNLNPDGRGILNKYCPSKYRYDLNIYHNTCWIGGHTRGYIETSEMELTNAKAAFSPYMRTAYNRGYLDWARPATVYEHFYKVTPETQNEYVYGGQIVTGNIQIVRVLEGDSQQRLCAFSAPQWNKLVEKCNNQGNRGTLNGYNLQLNDINHDSKKSPKLLYYDDVDLRDWHDDEDFKIDCAPQGPKCKKVRALCGYAHSAQLSDHLIKCLQVPYLPAPGKMYDYVSAKEDPRILYHPDEDFFHPKVILAIGRDLQRCKNGDYIFKGGVCSDGGSPLKFGSEYQEVRVDIPFKSDTQYKHEWASIGSGYDKFKVVLNINQEEICGYLESGESLNCVRRTPMQKPKNVQIAENAGKIIMTADFSENALPGGEQIKVIIPKTVEDPADPRTKDPFLRLKAKDRTSGKDLNEYNVGGYTFSFLRAKVGLDKKIKLQKKCSHHDKVKKKIIDRIIKADESCDADTTIVPVEDAKLCDGLVKAKTDSCTGTSIKVRKCPDTIYKIVESDPKKQIDCIIGAIDFYDESGGNKLCLKGYRSGEFFYQENPSTLRAIYQNSGFWEVAVIDGFWQIMDSPSSIVMSALNDDEKKSMIFVGSDIIEILLRGQNKFKNYRWQNKTMQYDSNNKTSWFYKSDNRRFTKSIDGTKMIPKSPAEMGLCTDIPMRLKFTTDSVSTPIKNLPSCDDPTLYIPYGYTKDSYRKAGKCM